MTPLLAYSYSKLQDKVEGSSVLSARKELLHTLCKQVQFNTIYSFPLIIYILEPKKKQPDFGVLAIFINYLI